MSIEITWPYGGQQVIVTGEFDDWKQSAAATKGDDGIFRVLIKPPSGLAELVFKFVVDGEWRTSPDFAVLTDALGNANNWVAVELASPVSVQEAAQAGEPLPLKEEAQQAQQDAVEAAEEVKAVVESVQIQQQPPSVLAQSATLISSVTVDQATEDKLDIQPAPVAAQTVEAVQDEIANIKISGFASKAPSKAVEDLNTKAPKTAQNAIDAINASSMATLMPDESVPQSAVSAADAVSGGTLGRSKSKAKKRRSIADMFKGIFSKKPSASAAASSST